MYDLSYSRKLSCGRLMSLSLDLSHTAAGSVVSSGIQGSPCCRETRTGMRL